MGVPRRGVATDGDRAELLARDAERTGATLSLAHWADGATAAPARRLTCAPVTATTVTARLAGRLELDVASLALGLVDRLRRTAAFANPMFFERERARLSTHKTPRVIACHELCEGRLLLPRGCLDGVRDELGEAGVTLVIEDERVEGGAIEAHFAGSLSADQDRAVDALARHETGVLVAPPARARR